MNHKIARIDAPRLPYSLRILLENLVRRGDTVGARAVMNREEREIDFMPARVLLQDFTGVPAVVDLAAMRAAMKRLGGDPKRVNPLMPAELVIDHSVQVDAYGSAEALATNARLEFQRNRERYEFLRWGQKAFRNFKVVPPDTGIVHQVNLEYLARVVDVRDGWAFPDTVVGTDSHTTMINGLGVLGWGVGGIEAEASMLGQPVTMLIPQVVGVRLSGELREGATATDLVLRATEILRKKGVVGKFVEYFGPGLAGLPLADRATLANMAPEYGATCGIFPVDAETLKYLRFSGRPEEQVRLVEEYTKAQGLFWTPSTPDPEYSDVVDLDLGSIVPALAGPKRPQDRVNLPDVKASFAKEPKQSTGPQRVDGYELRDGSVVIAAITSCTNTSNPSVLIAAGLLAKKAAERGLTSKPWVKTSLAPGSQVVTDYLREAGLLASLEKLNFHLVGYGCTTCIGNSGPLAAPISAAIEKGKLTAVAVLSGNRNFEGRVSPDARANYLASPPLVVAYALAGRIDIDLTTEPLGTDGAGRPVFLRDLWPSRREIEETLSRALRSDMFRARYADVYTGDEAWRAIKVPEGDTYAWDAASTYIKHPPYFETMGLEPAPVADIKGARVLAMFGDSITTDHISPAGSIKPKSPAGLYLQSLGVAPADFNSYGSRRGNHEVMARGTFANTRIKNLLLPGVEGGETLYNGARMSIYDAAVKYAADKTPLIVIAGKEYGSGSSRDWAAKGPMLLGVRAVIAQSFERIHRSNLIGMGILPLEFIHAVPLTGRERFDVALDGTVTADGRAFRTRVRLDTPVEKEYYRHGGILPYVLRQLLKS